MDCCKDESRTGASRCGVRSVWSHCENFLGMPYPLDVYRVRGCACMCVHKVAHLAKECPASMRDMECLRQQEMQTSDNTTSLRYYGAAGHAVDGGAGRGIFY